jgi:hypothetical protein
MCSTVIPETLAVVPLQTVSIQSDNETLSKPGMTNEYDVEMA